MLTDLQKKVAEELLASRPAVIPGTRAIVKYEDAVTWHDKVYGAMREYKVETRDVNAFCDIAGVAD